MAKSTRSKVKRQWRAKKRNDSVYAVTEAARLHRLSQKLKTIVQTDAEGDYEVEDATAEGEGSENREQQTGGRYWLHFLGLVDQEEITPESMGMLSRGRSHLWGDLAARNSHSALPRVLDLQNLFSVAS